MDIPAFIVDLRNQLQKPLPGKPFQLKMSSQRRIREMMSGIDTTRAVRSSVLLLLYPSANRDSLLFSLIQRPEYDGVHSGQISLPGGRFEPEDTSYAATALRESREEVGIDPETVDLIGELSELYIPPSNFVVYPFVGYAEERPSFLPDKKEVEKIIEAGLNDLMEDSNIKTKRIHVRSGITVTAPCFVIEGNIIWGATAMMLSEFREIVKRIV